MFYSLQLELMSDSRRSQMLSQEDGEESEEAETFL